MNLILQKLQEEVDIHASRRKGFFANSNLVIKLFRSDPYGYCAVIDIPDCSGIESEWSESVEKALQSSLEKMRECFPERTK